MLSVEKDEQVARTTNQTRLLALHKLSTLRALFQQRYDFSISRSSEPLSTRILLFSR